MSVDWRGRSRAFHHPHHPLPAFGAGAFKHEVAVLHRSAEIDQLCDLAFPAEYVAENSVPGTGWNLRPKQLGLGGESSLTHKSNRWQATAHASTTKIKDIVSCRV